MDGEVSPDRDLAARAWPFATLWGVPLFVIVVTALAPVDEGLRTIAWTLSFAVAGVACLVNARRSGRLHCQVTGPFFLALSVTSALNGLAGVPFGPAGWWLIAAALAVGTVVLWVIPERRQGRYGERRSCC